MPRGQRKGVPKCDQHEFYLRPCQEYVSYPQQLSLSFCSAHEEKRGKSLGARGGCQQAPIYNTDRSCASPAFILPSDKDYYRLRRQEMLQEHNLRFGAFTEERSELNVVKPRSKHNFCNVCKLHYEDYLEHVLSQTHKNKLNASPFNRHIQELTKAFARQQPRKEPSHPSEESDSVQIISQPIKRIKTNETVEISDSPAPMERAMTPLGPCPTYYPAMAQQQLTFNCNMNYCMGPFEMFPFPLAPMNFQGFVPLMGCFPYFGQTMEVIEQ